MLRILFYILGFMFFLLFGNELLRYGIHNHTYLVAFMFFTIMARIEDIQKK